MADGVQFNYIPGSGLTAPIFSFEVNSGGQYQDIQRVILMGHMTAAGSMAENVATPVFSQAQVDSLAGPGSMLREMYRIAKQNAPVAPIWICAVPDSGVAPVWTLAVGSFSGIGVGTIEICGEPIQITFGSADTPATIAAELEAAINEYYNPLTNAMLPVTASVSGANVTVTACHVGQIMDAVDFFVDPLLANNMFASALSISKTTSGSGTPTVAAALANLGDQPADYIVSPWSDTTSLGAYTTALSDLSGRWAWNRQSYGHAWTAAAANFSALATLGLAQNDRHTTILGKIAGVQASNTLTLTEQPTANQTVTIGNGSASTPITFVANGATGPQVNIGVSLTATVAALLAYLQGSADANVALNTYAANGDVITATAKLPGRVGNSYTLATTVSGASVGGATFSGGLNGAPHPSWLWIAGACARVEPWLSDTSEGNIARNQTGLVIAGLKPPRDSSLWLNYGARNQLLNSGISTWDVDKAGNVVIDKLITTYQKGIAGQTDIVFRDIQSMYQVSGSLNYMRAQVGVEQGNKAIAPENPGNLPTIATPIDILGSFAHAYKDLENSGVLTNVNTATQLMVANIDSQNPARVNVFAPMQRVSPLDILATNAMIYQQLPAAA